MKLFIGVVKITEDIHKLDPTLAKRLAEEEPDHIILVSGEDASIHTMAVAELHMFEYRNVIYASWSVLEDIIYRLENNFNYKIVVVPTQGEYRCMETGYRGVFQGFVDTVQYLYMEMAKALTDLLGEDMEIIFYSEEGYLGRIVEKVVSDIVAIENRILGRWRLPEGYRGDPYIQWRMFTNDVDVPGLDLKAVERLRMAGLSYNYDMLRTMSNLLDNGILAKSLLENIYSEYYRGTESDREEYVLNVIHRYDLPNLVEPLSKLYLAAKASTYIEGLEDDPSSPVIRLARGCGKEVKDVLMELVS